MCQILSVSEQSLVSFVTVISSKVQNQSLVSLIKYLRPQIDNFIKGGIQNVYILSFKSRLSVLESLDIFFKNTTIMSLQKHFSFVNFYHTEENYFT